MKYPIQRWKHFRSTAKDGKRKRRPIRSRLKFRQFKNIGKNRRKPIPRIVVPSFFTLLNLFSGYLAIINISEGRFELGAWLIAVAGLFDAMDGFMARISNSTSEFGIELDSLSDIVSFGVAPGYLMYMLSMNELILLGVMVSALPPLCGAVRLARFNVNTKMEGGKAESFIGLPIPAQAIILTAFYLTFKERMGMFEGFEYGVNSIVIPLVILLSILMVSTVPFDKIPRFQKGSIKRNKDRYIFFFIYLVLIILFQQFGLMIAFSLFIIKGLWQSGVDFVKSMMSETEEEIRESEKI